VIKLWSKRPRNTRLTAGIMEEWALWVSMRRPIHRISPLLRPTLALFGALILAAPNLASAQETSSIHGAGAGGIRHILYLTIKSDPDARLMQQSSDEPITATLTVKTRISAHSQETNFYGDVPATVSDFDPIKGSREQEVWKDAQCHHERGFPKISVINVDGSITSGQKSLPIAARFRWLGRLLPGDEVMTGKRIASGSDDVGPFIATRTETKQSRLFVDLKLYILPCSLTAAAN
jgi:hypothetical protein